MSETIRVLIADDYPPFRAGVRALLRAVAGLEVIGEAGSGDEAIAQAEVHQPDVILMDLNMPGVNGIEATRRILAGSPHIGILVLTMFEDDDSVWAAMQAGARGYLLKGALKAEIVRAINGVASGEAIFGPSVARRLTQFFAKPRSAAKEVFPELTDREREILALIAEHRTNREIADRLVLSQKTVSNHISNIFSKLQIADRAEAIERARDAGLGRRE